MYCLKTCIDDYSHVPYSVYHAYRNDRNFSYITAESSHIF